MEDIPATILARIADDALPVVRRWWSSLSATERAEALTDWDERCETSFFAPQTGDAWEQLPVVIGGRFVPNEQSQLFGNEWHTDYFEYLLKHPELLLNGQNTTHICAAHPDARTALAAGCIPADFECPFASSECPMRQVLEHQPNHSLVLSLSRVRQREV